MNQLILAHSRNAEDFNTFAILTDESFEYFYLTKTEDDRLQFQGISHYYKFSDILFYEESSWNNRGDALRIVLDRGELRTFEQWKDHQRDGTWIRYIDNKRTETTYNNGTIERFIRWKEDGSKWWEEYQGREKLITINY